MLENDENVDSQERQLGRHMDEEMKFLVSAEGRAYKKDLDKASKEIFAERAEEQKRLLEEYDAPSLNIVTISGIVKNSQSYVTNKRILKIFPFIDFQKTGNIIYSVHQVIQIEGNEKTSELDFYGGILPIESGTKISALVFAGNPSKLEYLTESHRTPPGNMSSIHNRKGTNASNTPVIYLPRELEKRESVLQILTTDSIYSPFSEGFDLNSQDSYNLIYRNLSKYLNRPNPLPGLWKDCDIEAKNRVPNPREVAK